MFSFEEILDAAAEVYSTAYDTDYLEGVASLVAHLLVPDLDEDGILLIHRALKGS